jgi:hypothetical protein
MKQRANETLCEIHTFTIDYESISSFIKPESEELAEGKLCYSQLDMRKVFEVMEVYSEKEASRTPSA